MKNNNEDFFTFDEVDFLDQDNLPQNTNEDSFNFNEVDLISPEIAWQNFDPATRADTNSNWLAKFGGLLGSLGEEAFKTSSKATAMFGGAIAEAFGSEAGKKVRMKAERELFGSPEESLGARLTKTTGSLVNAGTEILSLASAGSGSLVKAGAMQGLGQSFASKAQETGDLTESLESGVVGGVVGGLFGGALKFLSKATPAVVSTISEIAQNINKKGFVKGVQKTASDFLGVVPQNEIPVFTNINQLKNALKDPKVAKNPEVKKSLIEIAEIQAKNQAKNFEDYVEVAKQHSLDKTKPSSLEFFSERLEETFDKLDEARKKIGLEKAKISSEFKNIKVDISENINQFKDDLAKNLGLSVEQTEKGFKLVKVQGRSKRITQSEQKSILDAYVDLVKNQNKELSAIDDIVDNLQNDSFSTLNKPVSTEVSGFLKNQAKKLNETVYKNAPEEYKKLNQEYAKFRTIEDLIAKKVGYDPNLGLRRGSSLAKQAVDSPAQRAEARKLLKEVDALMGTDLLNQADISVLVGKLYADPKATSLLENTSNFSKEGIIKAFLKKGLDKLTDPVEAYRSLILENLEQIKKLK